MAKNICGGGKYKLSGSKEDTISLPVSLSNLPATLEIERYVLNLKPDFHVSLVCIGKIIEKQKITIPNFLDKIVADFCEFTRENNIDILSFRDELKFASEEEKHSIVIMCDVFNLDKFFDLINEKYGLHLRYPPTHVTLYTLEPHGGIFLTDSGDIETMTKPIKNPGIKLEWKKF